MMWYCVLMSVYIYVLDVFHTIIGGKGRTGTVIACYLLYSGASRSPLQALELFAIKRSAKRKVYTCDVMTCDVMTCDVMTCDVM